MECWGRQCFALATPSCAVHLPKSVVVVPLTSNTDRLYPGEAVVSVDGQSSKAMADQIMAADKARLKSQLGSVGKADMQAVEDAIRIHLSLAK